MKIGLLSYEYPPETGFGGIGTYTWYQARALARLGHQVHVLAGMDESGPPSSIEHDGVLVHRYRASGLAMSAFHGLGRWKWWWTRQRLENSWSMYQGLKELNRTRPFDVLEAPECGAEGALVGRLMDVPLVVRFHSPSRLIMPMYDVQSADTALCPWIEQRGIQSAAALTSCSSFLAAEVHAKLGVRKPIEVIPNGIDLELFDHEPLVDVAGKYGLPKDKVTIVFLGRMEERKGIHLCGAIAESILRRHDAAFVFAGQDLFGYMANTLLPSLANQGLRGSVHYVGKLDLMEIRSLARTADIVLLPSLWENCPYSCLEAMAAGRAVVSSDQGGMPELIRDGQNGLLARCGVPESFAAQLDTLVKDAALRRRLGAAARRSVEQSHTDNRIARLSTEVYEKCVQQARGRTRRTRIPAFSSAGGTATAD